MAKIISPKATTLTPKECLMLKHVVRVVIPDDEHRLQWIAPQIDTGFLECLRYAGVVTIHETEHGQCFDIHCPKEIGRPNIWAEQNAARMKSFGYNAIAISYKK
jgi:hypothetical protein